MLALGPPNPLVGIPAVFYLRLQVARAFRWISSGKVGRQHLADSSEAAEQCEEQGDAGGEGPELRVGGRGAARSHIFARKAIVEILSRLASRRRPPLRHGLAAAPGPEVGALDLGTGSHDEFAQANVRHLAYLGAIRGGVSSTCNAPSHDLEGLGVAGEREAAEPGYHNGEYGGRKSRAHCGFAAKIQLLEPEITKHTRAAVVVQVRVFGGHDPAQGPDRRNALVRPKSRTTPWPQKHGNKTFVSTSIARARTLLGGGGRGGLGETLTFFVGTTAPFAAIIAVVAAIIYL